jgi:plasmid stabilization system protein ParE
MNYLPVSLSEEAYRDVDKVFDYILLISGNAVTAKSYTDRILNFCDTIGWLPEGGYRIRWKNRYIRRRIFERSFFVLYKRQMSSVEIIRIISVRRDERGLR